MVYDINKAIRILEGNYKNSVLRHNGELLTVNELIAMLKAQEPRAMSIEELGGLQEDDVVFVEIKPVRDLACISVELVRFIEKVQDPATWIELHTTDSAGFYMTRKTTEPNWRCWTSCPDQATREATPWN